MLPRNLGDYLVEILKGKYYLEEDWLSRPTDTQIRISNFVHSLWGLQVNLRLYAGVLEVITGEKDSKLLPTFDQVSFGNIISFCSGLQIDLARAPASGKMENLEVRYKQELQPQVNLLRTIYWADLDKLLEFYQFKINGTSPKRLYVGESSLLYPAKIEVFPHRFGKISFSEFEEKTGLAEKPSFTLLDYEMKKSGSPLEAICTYVNGPHTLDEMEGVGEELLKSKPPEPSRGGGLPAGLIDWMELLVLVHKIKDSPDNHFFILGNRQGEDSYCTHRPVVEFKLLD